MVPAFAMAPMMAVEEGLHPPASSFFEYFQIVSFDQVAFLLSLPRLYFFLVDKITCCVNGGGVPSGDDGEPSNCGSGRMVDSSSEDPQPQTPENKKRLSRGVGQSQAILAVRAFFSPTTKCAFRTNRDAAVAFGVRPQLFYKHETEMVESGV